MPARTNLVFEGATVIVVADLPSPRQPSWRERDSLAATAAADIENGTIGARAAGLLDDPHTPDPEAPTDQLVADLTTSMQSYAAHAKLARHSDLIPFLAKSLICNGWVTA